MKCLLVWLVAAGLAFAADEEKPKSNVRYKAGKEVNFEELLIQGQLKRPEITVVTGNTQRGGDGLLKLRENFLDRITEDAGEEIP